MKKIYLQSFALSLLLVLGFLTGISQNLISDPSAETVPTSNGWTTAQNVGTNCYTSSGWGIQGNQSGFPTAQSGNYLFFPGCGGTTGSGKKYELYQDIDVSSKASNIDAGHYSVSFSGYTQSYNQSTPDGAEIIVEYRNNVGTVLSSYSTGTTTNISGWVQYTDNRVAPTGTRTIRIRLIGTSNNGDSIDSYFDNLSLTATITLPVNFISFTAASVPTGCLLKWQTSDEINNRGFYIERSSNGISWESIGFIEAAKAGSGYTYQYQFTDANPAMGVNFYRLKQEDLDGKYEYSTVRNVQYQYSGRTFIFPNPVVNVLSIATQENKFKAQIINPEGKVVATFMNQKNISVQTLPSGIYYLRLLYGSRVENLRFVKR
ncbi:MAG: T9SS type A sorting domain-containing protein [Bacteroidetes bacterium]|nr:T9SS type A sorting domain-containing protein [Bacteroidota bacterium]